MAYQVLARKWRPKTFEQLVGQEHVVRALANALTQNRLHHAYLLTGTRGVGKTTIARIMAKSLNCETGVTAQPCGVCSACVQIDGGRYVDLLELDAASNTGIDNMREVLEAAMYAPSSGRFKVYIIDEVHMLSKPAFNAMLKTLEEPPPHVKFILATTDPQKVPVTILSRCLQFSLKQIPPAVVAGHLRHVLEQEAIPFEAPALNLLGRAAHGSMRDSLSLLDQAIAYGSGKVEEAGVRAMLGAIDHDYLVGLLRALADGDGRQLLQRAEDLAARGIGFDNTLQELAGWLQQVALAQTVPEAIADDAPERAELFELAGRFSPEDVQLYYQIAIHGRKDLALAPDEYAGFSMTLLRMLAFRPVEPGSAPPPKREAPPRPPASAGKPVGAVASPPPTQPQVGAYPVEESSVPAPAVQEPRGALPATLDWAVVMQRIKLSGMARQLAMHCLVNVYDAERLELAVPSAQKHLLMKSTQDALRAAVLDEFGPGLAFSLVVADVAGETMAMRAVRESAERQVVAEQSIAGDPLVQQMQQQFGAKIQNIRPE